LYRRAKTEGGELYGYAYQSGKENANFQKRRVGFAGWSRLDEIKGKKGVTIKQLLFLASNGVQQERMRGNSLYK